MRRIGLLIVTVVMLWAPNAFAFCGFYVGGAGAELFNDASQVVMMREGTKTILSMQNRYDGPVDDFALVIPVPEVLMEANVKTLENSVFDKLDRLTAPRLVEYFEQDPCEVPVNANFNNGVPTTGGTNNATNNGVTVEAEFKVGEYEIVVLSAEESTSLETWLTDNDYNLPMGAAPYYEPYIQAGMYFFVARVDPTEVTFTDDGRAVLSPLRFDYDSETFQLPVRLGMINSAGQQDIIIHTLGRSQRYEAANYGNVTIPTNKEVTPDTKNSFGDFYKTLFARTVRDNPDALVTEYSWQASNCDPCPGPVVDASDLLTLGADVLNGDSGGGTNNGTNNGTNGFGGDGFETDQSWVITRLHARFAKDEIGEDIVFREADPIVGGRQFVVGTDGELEQGAQPSDINNFQARYIIYHPWQGDIDCEDPAMGYWGEPTASGSAQSPTSTGGELDADENYSLAERLIDNVDELGIDGEGTREEGTTPTTTPNNGTNGGSDNNVENNVDGPDPSGSNNGTSGGSGLDDKDIKGGGCGGCATGGPVAPMAVLLVIVVGGVVRRRSWQF